MAKVKDYSGYQIQLPDAPPPSDAAPAAPADPNKDYSGYHIQLDAPSGSTTGGGGSVWDDVQNAPTLALSALGEGAAEALGMAGDVIPAAGNALGSGLRYLAGKPQLTADELAQMEANDPIKRAIRATSSESLKGLEKSAIGFKEFARPQSTAGQYAYEALRLLPGAVGGPATLGRAAIKEGAKIALEQAGKNALRYAAVPAVAGVSAEKAAEDPFLNQHLPIVGEYGPQIKAGVEALTGLGAGFHAAPLKRRPAYVAPTGPFRTAQTAERLYSPEDQTALEAVLPDYQLSNPERLSRMQAGAAPLATRSAKSAVVESAIERAKTHDDFARNPGRVLADEFGRITSDRTQFSLFNPGEQRAISQLANPSKAQRLLHSLNRGRGAVGAELGIGAVGTLLLEGGVEGLGSLMSLLTGHGLVRTAAIATAVHLARTMPARLGRTLATRRADILADVIRSGRAPTRRRFVDGVRVPDMPLAFPGVVPGVVGAVQYGMHPDDQP